MRRSEGDRQEEDDRVTRSLAGLAVILGLVVISLYLVQRLAEVSRVQDCVMSGRKNCETMDLSGAN